MRGPIRCALVQRLRVSARRVLSRPDAPYLVRIEAFLIATERMLGNWAEALELSYDLVRRLEMPQYSGNLESGRGLPIHYSVVSLTGCLAGDYRLAYSAAQLAFRAARAQGDLKEESHALGLLALASALQGRIEVAGEHLGVLKQVVSDFSGELDEFSWADAEIAQVVVAASRGDLTRASVHLQRLDNDFDRMEQWPLVVWAKAIVTGLSQDQGEAALLIERSLRNRPSNHEVSGHWEGRLLHFAANSALFMGHQRHAAALASRAEEFDPGSRGVELRQALMRHQFAHVVQGVSVAVQEESRPTKRLVLLLLGAVAADHLADSERSHAWWKELSEATDPSLAPWLLSHVPYDLYVLADTETGWNNPFADHIVDLDCGLRMRGYKPLTRAECEVLDALASDETIPEVAEELCLSVNTVKSHLQSVYAKLGVAKRGDAVRVARRIGAIPAR